MADRMCKYCDDRGDCPRCSAFFEPDKVHEPCGRKWRDHVWSTFLGSFADCPSEISDGWRIREWAALPDRCGIEGCDNDEADQRGPLFMRDGTMHKLCPEHWEAVFRILGEQATWQNDAHRSR